MLYLLLVGLQPVFDQRRQVVGMSRLMQPSCQHLTEFVKLVNHRRDDEPQHASYNSDSRSHGDEDRQRTYSDVEFVFDKLHDRDSYDYATWLHDNGGTYALYGAIPSYYKLEDMWQKPGDNAKLPKFQAGYGKGVLSSRWLMPNDYLRLKNLTLGFSAPKEWISNLGLSKARVYFSANNLLTWKSKDLYVDPETPADGLCTFEMPALRTYTFGIELSF